jgi:hypothetical protein
VHVRALLICGTNSQARNDAGIDFCGIDDLGLSLCEKELHVHVVAGMTGILAVASVSFVFQT